MHASVRRALGAGLVAALAALAPLAAPVQEAQAATSPVTVTVAPRNGGVVAIGTPLDLDVSVTNTGTSALPAGHLRFSIDAGPVASAAFLVDRIANPPEVLQGILLPKTATTPALAPGATRHVSVREPAADVDAALTAQSGTRVLYASFDAGGTGVVRETAITRIAKDFSGRIGLGAVIPLSAPANTTGIVDTAQQETLTASGGEWDDALRAAQADRSATLALDPAVPASIRLAGSAAPESATAFLTALAALPNEVVQLPYADADLTLERAAGAPVPLAPGSFAASTATVPETQQGTASPTPTPAASAVPSRSDLLAWNWSGSGLAWPVPGTTSAADLGLLGGQGRTVLLAAGDVKDGLARAAAGPAVTVNRTKALLADTTVSTLLRSASVRGTAGDAALAQLVGVLGTDAVTGAAPAVLAVPSRGADLGGLGRVLSVLKAQRWIDGRTLASLASGTATSVLLAPHAVSPSRVATARQLLAGESAVRDLGQAVQDSSALIGPERLALLGLLSARWRGADTAWSGAAAAATKRFTAFVDLVHVNPGGSALYTGDSSYLLVDVENGLPAPVTLEVHGTSSNGRLKVTGDGSVRITVPASSHKGAKLPIRSITNGKANVTVTLWTPQGKPIGSPTTREITVQAGFEVIVAVALIAALGLLFLTGVYRNVTRQRRRLAARKEQA